MDTSGPSGFRNAPVTKLLVQVVGGCSAIAAMLDARSIPIPISTLQHPLWRLFVSPWTFTGLGPTVVGTWLIYRMRILERRFGSAKYAAFVFVTVVTTSILQLSLMFLGYRGMLRMSSGPYALIFAMLYQFYELIPASSSFQMLGTSISDKAYVYIAAAQMLFSHSLSAIGPCLCGLVAGILYHTDVGGLKRWRFPRPIRRFARHYVLPILSSSGTTSRPVQQHSRTRPVPNTTGLRQRRTANTTVSEESINTVASMFPNYSREAISNALAAARNDLNRAAEILLNENAQ